MAADLTFLFWNTAGNRVEGAVAALAERYQVDVVMLAECSWPSSVTAALNQIKGRAFQKPFSESKRVLVLTRFSRRFLEPLYEDDRVSIRRLRLPARAEILLVVVHLRSKLHRTEGSQSLAITRITSLIEEQERRQKHARTIAVGDFNMNPFEPGIVGAGGLHAIASRRIALQGSRVVEGRSHRFFYNPMWNFLGDARGRPPGTYYRRHGDNVEYFWHVFDQVLVRPDLLQGFDAGGVQVLTTDGSNKFLSGAGIPSHRVGSDHLPLLFKIRL